MADARELAVVHLIFEKTAVGRLPRINGSASTYPQFQIHLSTIDGSFQTFASYCAGNVVGQIFVAGGAGGC